VFITSLYFFLLFVSGVDTAGVTESGASAGISGGGGAFMTGKVNESR